MGFEAASESLDGYIHIVSVTGQADLATRPELDRALFALPEALRDLSLRAAALNGDGDD